MESTDLSKLPKAKDPVKLPTLAELFDDNIELAGKSEGLNAILNVSPPEKWVLEHNGYKYLPIEKVEYLLTKIFKQWNPEVLKTGMLMNSVEVTVRLHYFNPATGQMQFSDGVGAWELQTKKDSGALKMDMSNVNRGAVAMALPAAKSEAIKDAAHHLGKVFGKDLNRKNILSFFPDELILSKVKSNKEKLNGTKN